MHEPSTGKIRVFVIDDSAVIRNLLSEMINASGDMEVVGTAIDPVFALQKIEQLKPDIVTLDVEMPRMDGLSFLESIMERSPMPVLMISALTPRGSETALKALELGAVDCIEKPSIEIRENFSALATTIVPKIRAAARAKARKSARRAEGPLRHEPKETGHLGRTTDRIIAIGASTGGTQAITEILSMLPESVPGIVIAQHMPPVFTRSFAERLDAKTRLDVKEAATGDRAIRGNVLIAPGNEHMTVKRDGAMYYARISGGPQVNFSRPSIDVLFNSVAKEVGPNAVGVLLTGMGEDGARGLLEMRRAGAFTIAQDEASSVVFGMPKKAIELGGAATVRPLEEIAQEILRHV